MDSINTILFENTSNGRANNKSPKDKYILTRITRTGKITLGDYLDFLKVVLRSLPKA